MLRIKFSAGRQFSSPKSPTSCSCKTLCVILMVQPTKYSFQKNTYLTRIKTQSYWIVFFLIIILGIALETRTNIWEFLFTNNIGRNFIFGINLFILTFHYPFSQRYLLDENSLKIIQNVTLFKRNLILLYPEIVKIKILKNGKYSQIIVEYKDGEKVNSYRTTVDLSESDLDEIYLVSKKLRINSEYIYPNGETRKYNT